MSKDDVVLQDIDAFFAASFEESWPIRPPKWSFSLIQALGAVCCEYAELINSDTLMFSSVTSLERERESCRTRGTAGGGQFI